MSRGCAGSAKAGLRRTWPKCLQPRFLLSGRLHSKHVQKGEAASSLNLHPQLQHVINTRFLRMRALFLEEAILSSPPKDAWHKVDNTDRG
jgi:hypothetical protein